MRTKGTPAELEARRLRAAELLGRGKGTNEVARLVGVLIEHARGKNALKRGGGAAARGDADAIGAAGR
ncbi:MAG: hypothetical protein IT435_12875 [Phycisphaerales bacterium]|nr:hypothetical protein [Phycisphaerales bacterium]